MIKTITKEGLSYLLFVILKHETTTPNYLHNANLYP